MGYNQRNDQARTDTTRLLKKEGEEGDGSVLEYLEGARHRSARFAETAAQLRDIHAEIDTLGREAHNRPTGVLSGGDVDIAYHYMGMALGIVATLYSFLGTVFALHGGSTAMLAPILEQWSTGPAAALANALLNVRTLAALILQAVLFVVMIATRRNRFTWQHWAALMASVALSYVGWSSVLLTYGVAPVSLFAATIPAAVLGGALTWAIVRGASDIYITRTLMIGIVCAGVLAGALGVAPLIHWVGLLIAWAADQVARRIMVVG